MYEAAIPSDTGQALYGQLCGANSTQRLGHHFHRKIGRKGCTHPISAAPGAVYPVGRFVGTYATPALLGIWF